MKLVRILALALPLVALSSIAGQDKKSAPKKVTTATDPKDAGVDFLIQGEYASKANGTVAAQVFALGGGKFDVYVLEGGLAGAGWNGKTRVKASAVLNPDEKTATIKGKEVQGTITLGDPATLAGETPSAGKFLLTRVVRKSPTLGAKPPQGAKVLFDGTNVDNWKGGRLAGDLLAAPATSKDSYKIAKLHVEFVTPFMPYARGQGRGNSGVYVFGHEIQVLDSFGLEGKNNECGAIYGRRAPDVNMCLPPLSWQTFDVDITSEPSADKKKPAVLFTVYHNGVKVHDKLNLGTGSSGGLLLQNHGNRVFYRNIWVVEAK